MGTLSSAELHIAETEWVRTRAIKRGKEVWEEIGVKAAERAVEGVAEIDRQKAEPKGGASSCIIWK